MHYSAKASKHATLNCKTAAVLPVSGSTQMLRPLTFNNDSDQYFSNESLFRTCRLPVL